MGSSRPPDRSLGSGISFPQWMKGKVVFLFYRFDFDQSTFSPPSHDDSFFYISYNKLGSRQSTSSSTAEPKEGFQSINSVLSENPVVVKAAANIPVKNANIDLSKHPIACQQSFLNYVSRNRQNFYFFFLGEESSKLTSKFQQGDEFENSTVGLCGKSIVSVANRIMSSSSSLTRKITNDPSHDDAGNFASIRASAGEITKRRGSRSLPVSPISSPISTPDSSPKSRRRVIQNRFFTGGLVEKPPTNHGWFLSSILNQSRDILGQNRINEEEEEVGETSIAKSPPIRSLSRKKSISSQNLTYLGTISAEESKKGRDAEGSSVMASVQNIFQPDTSEMREMNFLSPTSM
ncbi:GSCOCG00007343001-RA-CDS [Cotesia congregata]|nr:GSCOCG00007343001-RA-CDS [Cotesia congregata]